MLTIELMTTNALLLHLISIDANVVRLFIAAADVHADQLEQSEETRRTGERWCRGHDRHFVSSFLFSY